jgi:adenylate cyclase
MVSRRARRQLRTLGVVIAVACLVTPFFNLLTSERSLGSALQGIIDTVLVGLLIGGWLLFVRDGWLRAWLRRWNFSANLLINLSVLLVLFLLGRAAGQVLTSGQPERFVRSFSDAHLLYAIPFFALFTFGLLFVLQMNRMIGTNVLGYFVAGVYHRPKREERIFLFLDLRDSTRLAERLGSGAYYELLRRFVEGLSEPILESEGEIYQYAGDEVVVVWRQDRGVRRGNCVRCFFLMREAIARGAAAYAREFGVVPAFRGGLHGGTVIAGELGDLKQQIVFVGDILNTAARLEEYARRHDLDLVASGALLQRLELPEGVKAEFREELAPRGKGEKVSLYALRQADLA